MPRSSAYREASASWQKLGVDVPKALRTLERLRQGFSGEDAENGDEGEDDGHAAEADHLHRCSSSVLPRFHVTFMRSPLASRVIGTSPPASP